jgi:Calcineurin-like phosphoesterase
MRTLVIGDIHGNFNALKEVLASAGYDSEKDRFISLGDIYDGHPESARCVEFLRQLPNFIWCLGNHDSHARWWLRGDWKAGDPEGAWSLGPLETVIDSYRGSSGELDRELIQLHREFIETAVPYYIDEANRLYVHAGIDWRFPVDEQPQYWIYYADRLTYREYSVIHEKEGTRFPYKDVFIGHTKTIKEHPKAKPVRRANLWNLDTGAGTHGKLTVMDADTYEYWQSGWCK